jgi:SAM-dependent methyltransferase
VNWEARYRQQAGWTRDLRQYLYQRAGLKTARRVLDLGCGTGALLNELLKSCKGEVHGLDIDAHHLDQAHQLTHPVLGQKPHLVLGDAHALPYSDQSFDITLCHFVLLWLQNPAEALNEMRRVTRPGGALLALAEPDYGGRIDYPEELGLLGKLQEDSLRKQGADTRLGRQLLGMLERAGLKEIEGGILGAQWTGLASPEERALEWAVMQEDLLGEKVNLEQFEALDREAWQKGERVLYVPTFYAWGRV